VVEAFRTGKNILVDVLHYGCDESGRPEMPRAIEWRTL
jgi:hypothetical protein